MVVALAAGGAAAVQRTGVVARHALLGGPRGAGAAPVSAGGRSVHPLHETGWLQIKGGGEGGDKFLDSPEFASRSVFHS